MDQARFLAHIPCLPSELSSAVETKQTTEHQALTARSILMNQREHLIILQVMQL